MELRRKYTFFYIAVLMIPLLLEHISNPIGGIIKVVLLLTLLIKTLYIGGISVLLVLFCLFFLLNGNADLGIGIIFELSQIIYFPVSFFYFIRCYKDKKSLQFFSEILAYAIIFSSLFFILNILNQDETIVNELKVLSSKFDDGQGKLLHFGFFEHPSAASKLYVLSVIIVVFKREKSLIDYIALPLGFYLVYITYVRLGWLTLFFALILLVRNQKSVRLKLFMLLAFCLSLIKVLPLLMNRLFNFTDVVTLTSISSGRDLLILKSLDFICNISAVDFMIGSGYDVVMERIGYAHNRFIEVLIFGGFLSFLLWLSVYRKIYLKIKPSMDQNYLVISILFLILTTMLFSHGFSPYLALLSAIALVANLTS